MKVLVAGATGLAGSAIAKAFKAEGHDVVSANRTTVDLLNFDASRRFLRSIKPNLVIDAAAKVGGIGDNNSKPVEFLSDNLRIQNNLMQASFEADVEKFVFLGSSCIYPRDCSQPIKEEYLMTGPLESSNSAYAVAKIAGIEMINSYRKEFGLNWISVMPTNLYGPGDNFNLETSHVLPALIRKFIEAESSRADIVSIWGTGSPLREFMHVNDLATAVIVAVEKYDSALHLNIGTGQELSILNLANKIAELTGYKGKIVLDPTKPDGTPRKVLDVTRISALGWRPTITLENGLASTIDWYKQAVARGEVRL
ncbi:WcaG Nucleoside-diphosphate-sugar epimerases [Candidatus Planktophila vernalis]|uniref:GDP-L-fucose synthase family protein n=1 Tax=Candidatus Planktophila vernalis TaxID=1884907 RepID=UPI003CF1069B